MHRRHLAFVLTLALAACGGGGGGGTSGGGGGGGGIVTPPTAGPTQAFLVIQLPSVGPSGTKRPLFVDPSTNSIGISINGVPVAPSAVSTACNNSTPQTCSATIAAPPGDDTFDILLGVGNTAQSHGTVTATIVAGQTTTLHLTFHGIVASAVFKLDRIAPPAGAPSTIHLSMIAYDPAGNQIIGDDYDTPVTVAQTDPSGHMHLASNVFRNPTDALDVNYDGHLMSTQASYAAADSAIATRVTAYAMGNPYTFYPVGGSVGAIARGANGTMWFADCYPDHTCAPAMTDATGHVTEFAHQGAIAGVALGPDGNAWFTGAFQNPNVYRVTPTGVVTTFVVRAISPIEAYETHGIVAGPDGNMWFAEGDRIDKMTMAGVVTHYPLANYYRPSSLVVGPDGRLWFDDDPEIAAIDMSGTISHYTISQGRDTTSMVAWGSDGLLHFSAYLGGGPGGCYCTMTTAGVEGIGNGSPQSGMIAEGPNGAIWSIGIAQIIDQNGLSTGAPAFTFLDSAGRTTAYPYYDPAANYGTGFQSGPVAFSTDGSVWAAGTTGLAKLTYDP